MTLMVTAAPVGGHFDNFVDHLRALAARRPHDTALTVVGMRDGALAEQRLDYASLDLRVRALAARLQRRHAAGARVLLLLDNDDHYVVAFLACLYAGLIAVPAFPPESGRACHLSRLAGIAADAEAGGVLATARTLALIGAGLAEFGGAVATAVDAADAVDTADADDARNAADWHPHTPAPDDIAFLQYTSGSTSAPKGVMVSHANLAANELAIAQWLGTGADDVVVSWLPLYHDMGLIGGLLQPLYRGIPAVLMSPRFFLERPARWLEAISRHGGTISGGPDFAYRLCCERAGAAPDLSRWRVAFSGAEPVRPDTLLRFVQTYAEAGFSAAALRPCYGLAEATLLVAGAAAGGMTAPNFDAASLAQGRAQAVASGTALAACGAPAAGHAVRILDAGSQQLLEQDAVGEIWVAGPSIARGYWNQPEATRAGFVERDGRHWLRTGDLGFMHEGQLYVTGRVKDLIIVRGHNLYPQDLEQAVEANLEAVRKGRIAAFAVEGADGEGIGIAAEVSRGMQKLLPAAALVEALIAAVGEASGEPASVVVLLNPGALPKTSSGKLQRQACRAGWRARSLDAYAIFEHGRFVLGGAAASAPGISTPGAAAGFAAAGDLGDAVGMEVAAMWREVLDGGHALALDGATHFFGTGGNSLAAARLVARIAARWNIEFTLRQLFDQPRLGECAALVRQALSARDASAPAAPVTVAAATAAATFISACAAIPALPVADRGGPLALSRAQRRQWFLWRLAPEATAYHLAARLTFDGALDTTALGRSLDALVARHESLRTVYQPGADGEGEQRVMPPTPLDLEYADLRSVPASDGESAAAAMVGALIARPFDLLCGPLLRATLIAMPDQRHLLVLVVHHIAADGMSMALLSTELYAFYSALAAGVSNQPAPLAIQYADYAAWESKWVDSAAAHAQLTYWVERFGREHAPLALPYDHARKPGAAQPAARLLRELPSTLADKLRASACASEDTVLTLLLTAFLALLHRYSGQDDVRVGIPFGSRTRAGTEGLVGMFVNTVVLRALPDARQGLGTLREQVRRHLREAQENGELPFDRLVEVLQPERVAGHSPLFQVLFNQVPEAPPAMTGIAGLRVNGAMIAPAEAQFDLSVEVSERRDGGIAFALVYAADLFDAPTIERVAANYLKLLEATVATPSQALGEIALGVEADVGAPLPATDTALAVHQAVALRAKAQPERIALSVGDQQITYCQLELRANRLAHQLLALGAGAERLVAIALSRDAGMVVALLAVLKTGAAYLPVDPALPAERIHYMLSDSGAQLLLVDSAWQASGITAPACVRLLDLDAPSPKTLHAIDIADTDPAFATHAGQLAYVIYTSGSTGRPKAVMVRHGALSNFLASMRQQPGIDADDVVVAATSLSFDIAALEIFLPLLAGARLAIASREQARDGVALAALIARSGATMLQATPSGWRLLLAAGWQAATPGFKALCGGEALPPDLAQALCAAGVGLWNMYGPTETTIWSAVARIDGAAISLGAPVADTRLYVLDADLQPSPPGAAGELCIGGETLARGYLGRAGLSAERFVADPLRADGARMYRTGDLVRRGGDGALQYLARLDHQVKVRGFRIELGEIEAALLARPEVGAAVVVALRCEQGDRLAAYVSPASGATPDAESLRQALALSLPDYMVPGAIMVLDALPLNNSGKIDRHALPAPDAGNGATGAAPQGAAEEELARAWCAVLGAREVGRDDNFFALGGDSISSLKLVARLAQDGLHLAPRQVFEQQRLDLMALCIAPAATPSAPIVPIDAVARRDGTPLSNAQRRQWFLWRLEPTGSAYHISGTLHFTGAIDADAVRAAFAVLVARHESLRTVFRPDRGQEPLQRVLPALQLDIPLLDLSAADPQRQDELMATEIARVHESPFDLEDGPLIRIALVRRDGMRHALALAIHHIVADGWSMQVIVDEFAAAYGAALQGREAPLAALPIQYADYAAWQRNWLEQGDADTQLAWWRAYLGEDHPVLELPTDRPRRTGFAYRAGRLELALPAPLSARLAALARAELTTLFVVLLAAFQGLLHRHTGQADVRVGVPVTNRGRPETEGVVGFFVNAQVMRADIDERMPLADLLAQMRAAALGAQANQDLPFEKLVEALQPGRDLSHSPLFRVVMNHQRVDHAALRALPGLAFDGMTLGEQQAQFELALDTVEGEGGALLLRFSYAVELFEPDTVRRLADHYVRMLAAFAADTAQPLGDVMLIDGDEQARLVALGQPLASSQGATLPALHVQFEAHAMQSPDAVALVDGALRLSYAELNCRANRLAHALLERGVGPESRIGLAFERGADLVVAILATLKSGAAYVPLDPDYPAARLAYIAADSGLRLVLAPAAVRARLPSLSGVLVLDPRQLSDSAAGRTGNPGRPLHPEALAYLIYTSGSTGQPKGAQLSHANVARLLSHTDAWFGFGAGDVWTLFHSFAFDFSVWEMFGALCRGGSLVIVPYAASRAPDEFLALLRREAVTVLNQTPSAFRQLMQAPGLYREGLPALRLVIFGGEALAPQQLAPWFEHFGDARPRLVNMYGITETTVHVTYRPIVAADVGSQASPIGRAIPDLGLHVLDVRLQPCPPNVAGELHVSGAGLARGYLGRAALSAERFIADPFGAPGSRLYRSGDLARRRADGEIEYLGRIDDQVKVRGFRIELGEIEDSLRRLPGVSEAVVIARREAGGTGLLAYVVPDRAALLAAGGGQSGTLVGQWRSVFDGTYAGIAQAPSFRGWNSSYTEQPIAEAQMQEWLDRTVDRIAALPASRILEIGCGVGLLIQRLAPRVAHYTATDLSARAVADLREWLPQQPALGHVVLRQQEARDFTNIGEDRYDAVILNSVAQYFPDLAYFITVLRQARQMLAPGGSLFVGDLRHLAHLPLFHTSVQLEKADPGMSLQQLRVRVARAVSQEKELVLDPALFEALRARLGMGRLKVQLRRGRHDNELTRYRYDVTLTQAPPSASVSPEVLRIDGGAVTEPAALEALLRRVRPAQASILGLANRRMVRDLAAWRLLHREGAQGSVAELRRRLADIRPSGFDPEDFWEVGERLGYAVDVTWSAGADDGRFDVLFSQPDAHLLVPDVAAREAPVPAWEEIDGQALATDPSYATQLRGMAAQLREQLAASLPSYMVPGHFAVLDSMPLTPSGKLDRRALPEPERVERSEYAPPQGPAEEALALLWAEVLQLARVGRDDDFFEIGGHSLMAIQIAGLLAERHGIELPVRRFFDHHTVAALAATLDPALFAAGRGKQERLSQLDDLLREFEA